MNKHLKKFTTRSSYETYIGGEAILPNVSICADRINEVHYNPFVLRALKFTASGNSTLGIINEYNNNPVLEYSLDGKNWTSWDYSTIDINDGESVFLRGMNQNGFSKGSSTSSRFTMTGSIACEGNIMWLLDYTQDLDTIPFSVYMYSHCFYRLFYDCAALTSAPELPATTLGDNCYNSMFKGCTSLVTAPELPATTLADSCYYNMFSGCSGLVNGPSIIPASTLPWSSCSYMFKNCTNLISAPTLLATTFEQVCCEQMFFGCTNLINVPDFSIVSVANRGCKEMFKGCTSLVTAPELPATTLGAECYYCMFEECSGLVNAPELPATTLADSCYYAMFYNCTSLVTAPELPATTLVHWCYRSMFNSCSSLSSVTILATDLGDSYNLYNWVLNCSPTGTFTKKAGVTYSEGYSGIPGGWTVIEV